MLENSFISVAFMNYFQRPAEQTGDSISVSPLDIEHSAATVGEVVRIVRPDLVVFCSSLAWKAAKRTTLLDDMRGQGLLVKASSHPSCAWWNRPSKRLKGRSGKAAFMAAVAEVIAINAVEAPNAPATAHIPTPATEPVTAPVAGPAN